MKVTMLTAIAMALAWTASAQSGGKSAAPLKSQGDREAYSMGQTVGTSLRRQGVDVDLAMMIRGLRDAYADHKSLMTAEAMNTTMLRLNDRIRKSRQRRKQAQGPKNSAEGAAFLAANKKKKGVVTLPSGLQYKILRKGKGRKPGAGDKVTTHYRGTLIDGTEFDSSYQRGRPASFAVGGVIPGWTQALQLMREGAKWKLFIPAALAYGARGAGAKIGADATLIFEIELLKIN